MATPKCSILNATNQAGTPCRVSVIKTTNSSRKSIIRRPGNDNQLSPGKQLVNQPVNTSINQVFVDRFAEAESVKQLEKLCNRLTGFPGEPILSAAHTAVLQADLSRDDGRELLRGKQLKAFDFRPSFKQRSPSPCFTTSSPSNSVQSVSSGNGERKNSNDNSPPGRMGLTSPRLEQNVYIRNLLETPSKALIPPYVSDIFPSGSYQTDHLSPTSSRRLDGRLDSYTSNFPTDEKELLTALNTFDWCTFDQYRIPCVCRKGRKFVSVQMMQLRILIKYTKPLPVEQARRLTMPSYRMTLLEAWTLNTVNALYCDYDCGYTVFQEGDELVEALDAENFYWVVKVFNLRDTLTSYKQEIRVDSSVHFGLADHISSLKRACESELKTAESKQKRLKVPQKVGRKRKFPDGAAAPLPPTPAKRSGLFPLGITGDIPQPRQSPYMFVPPPQNHIQILKVQGNYRS